MTFLKHPYIVHLPYLKSLISVCQNIVLGDSTTPDSASTLPTWAVALAQAPQGQFQLTKHEFTLTSLSKQRDGLISACGENIKPSCVILKCSLSLFLSSLRSLPPLLFNNIGFSSVAVRLIARVSVLIVMRAGCSVCGVCAWKAECFIFSARKQFVTHKFHLSEFLKTLSRCIDLTKWFLDCF